MRTTDALNLTQLPRRVSAAEIDDFRVEPAHAPGGARGWAVTGEALARFAAMTNWDYYEASLRFQKVLEVAGARARGQLNWCLQILHFRQRKESPRVMHAALQVPAPQDVCPCSLQDCLASRTAGHASREGLLLVLLYAVLQRNDLHAAAACNAGQALARFGRHGNDGRFCSGLRAQA